LTKANQRLNVDVSPTQRTWSSSKGGVKVLSSSLSEDSAQKQCQCFTEWLNFMILPSNGAESESDDKKRPAFKTLVMHQRLAQARTRGLQVFNTSEMMQARNAIVAEISRGKLSLREDRDMYADLSQRSKIMSLLLSYSYQWLQIGLEILFGEAIPSGVSTTPHVLTKSKSAPTKETSTMRTVLKNVIVNKLLTDSATLHKYTKGRCNVPSGRFEIKYREDMRTVIITRLLVLIIFLDKAKRANVLDRVPCLFGKDSTVKSTRDVLRMLCRDFMSSEGDIIKHLSKIGIVVSYKQDILDELDLKVNNLAVDIRDGVCFARMTEIFSSTNPKAILSKLRLPAVSRLQKLHNVGMVLEALTALGVPNLDEVASHHIVDGYREQVLELLWTIFVQLGVDSILNYQYVEMEIEKLEQTSCKTGMIWNQSVEIRSNTSIIESMKAETREMEIKKLMLRWCNTVLAPYGITVSDFSRCFADGIAICFLIHCYHPALLSIADIKHSLNQGIDQSQAVINDRYNIAMAGRVINDLGGIPNLLPDCDTKNPPESRCMFIFLLYLCSRLLESSAEVASCLRIQAWYRRRMTLSLIEKKIAASKCIWSCWKERKENYYSAQKKTYKLSVDIIERFFWNKRKQFQDLRNEREFLQLQTRAVTIIQAYIRKCLSQLKLKFFRRISSSIRMLQKWWRAQRFRRFIHELFIKQSSVACIQSMWRRKSARNRNIIVSHGLILLQALIRGHFSRRLQIVKVKAATEIQRVWRGFTAQVLFHIDKLDIITVQSLMRRNIAARKCNKKQVALRKIQAFSRMILTMRKVEQYRIHLMIESSRHQAALLFQSAFRGYICRLLQNNKGRVEHIEKHSKGWNKRFDDEKVVHAIPKIQSVVRQLMTSPRMQKINYSALLIQTRWRCFKQKKLMFQNVGGELANIQFLARSKHLSPRFKFHFIHHQATVIQKTWRRAIMQTKYRHEMKLTIQSIARKTMREKVLPLKISEAATLQRCERIRKNCIKNSSWELMRRAECQAENERRAVVLIQRRWRQLNVMALKHGVAFQKKGAGVHWPTFFVQLIMRYVISMYFLRKLAFERERRKTSMIKHAVLVRRDYKRRIAINYTDRSGYPLFYSTKKFDNEKTAATAIQSWIRVYLSKTEMAKKLKVIRQVQSIWKMSRARIAYSCYLRSILLIQSTLRLFIATKLASRRRTSLIKIQSFARMIRRRIEFMKIRIDFLSRKEEMIIMARRLQAFWRTIRMKFIQKSMRQRNILIPTILRRRISTSEVTLNAENPMKYCLAKAKLQFKRVEHDRESLCLLRIQALFRGWQTRKLIQRQSLAAIIIQREWKCFVAFLQYHSDMVDIIIVQSVVRRHQARTLILRRSKAVYKMQSIARRYLALKRASLRYIDMLSRTEVRSYCSITIQSAYRCYKAKASVRSYRAARTIQKAWRCFSCQMNYLLKLISILSIQRYIRAYNITKKKEKSIFLHIAVFQAICRGSKARQHYHRIRSEIIKLQCFYRGHIARRNLDREHRSAINIQRITRGFLDRTDIQICAFAAADIQRCWRGFLGRIDATFKFLMILRLQNLARRFLASQLTMKKRQQGKREQSLQRQKAIVIKRDFSNHLRRQEQNRAASVIQRFLTYCIFSKLNMAAIVIQRCFRNMKIRKLQNEQQLRATRKTSLASKRAIQHSYQILGLRTQRALWIVQNSTRMREIKEAAKILEASTRLSITCCRAFVDIGAPNLLYNLMNACNRSLPHIEILTYLLLTLQNVSKHKSLVEKMASVHAAEIFLDLVQMLRDKSNIFRITLTLLYLYARTSEACKGVCSRPESLKRLNHVLNRVLEMELGRRDQPKSQKYWGRTMTNEDDAIRILQDFLMFLK
jgi:abnormal spindle-like microcephaly-associated protein